jgi:hypothetical protein
LKFGAMTRVSAAVANLGTMSDFRTDQPQVMFRIS